MKGNDYAVRNLLQIKENIYAYATYAENWPDGEIYDKTEEAQEAIDNLIKAIEKECA